jgi:hypothetical protein
MIPHRRRVGLGSLRQWEAVQIQQVARVGYRLRPGLSFVHGQ